MLQSDDSRKLIGK